MLHPSTDIIMNAQQFFAADQSEANLVKLLHVTAARRPMSRVSPALLSAVL